MRAQKLVDVHVPRHGTDNKPPTYARGSQRIDYILASGEVAQYVNAAGILLLHKFCGSDNRAVYADVKI